jgi:hypothetical protein
MYFANYASKKMLEGPEKDTFHLQKVHDVV